MTAPAENSVEYWEMAAAQAWGRYITATEQTAVEHAQQSALSPRHALDVGCGGGRWTRFLIDRGWSVTALDVDPGAVRTCADRNPTARCLLVDPGMDRLPADDGSVSLVVCIEVLAVTHSDWFPDEARRVLAPGGHLVTVVWNRWSLRGIVTDAVSRVRHRAPHTHYRTSYRRWRRELRDAGFRVRDEKGLCWFPFGRMSDSALVPACVAVERRLRLSRLPSLSPWVVVTASVPAQDPAS